MPTQIKSFLPLLARTKILFANLCVFYAAFVFASGRWLPTGGLESVWLLSAAALWFLALLSSPWFVPPRDGLVNAISVASILITVDLSAVPKFGFDLDVIRWVSVSYCVVVIILSLVSLFTHDNDPAGSNTKFYYRLTAVLSRGELLYTPPALISILGAYQNSYPTIAWLLLLWMAFAIAHPIERFIAFWTEWRALKAGDDVSTLVGNIDRVDHPNIVRVKLRDRRKWETSSLHIAIMPDGSQRFVLALFSQIQGSEVMGTGLCVAAVQDRIPGETGQVYLSRDRDKVAEFIENLSGEKGAELVGFTVENSTIAVLRFEMAVASTLEEGDVVFARIDGKNIYYQILDAETAEENFDQNPRGTQIVRVGQLGSYSPEVGFKKFPWLPSMNTPLFSVKGLKFSEPKISNREFIIGNVPSTNVGVAANIDDIVEYHTAILGVTGTGKTELALDVVREAAKCGVKVFCVDFTGDYRERLADLKPELPAPTEEEVKDLEAKLFAVETGEYGAKAEKKALKEGIDKLRDATTNQIRAFLESDDGNLAIFELGEITNTKATLRLTELYLSTIMAWARSNRRARQIMIVLEEAHTIVPETMGVGFDNETQWVVSRIGQIALQGRKYGVGLMVVTQRTALVSKTILSQCNTFFTHSLIDQTSLNFLDSVYSSQHTRLIPNLAKFQFLAFGKGLRSERPILLCRPFDPAKQAASEKLRKPLNPKKDAKSE